jgi:LPXTG-motif cell wall-anchored protein
MRRFLGVMAFAVAATGFAAVPAYAQEQTAFEIPLDTVVRGAPGSEHLLATEQVAPDDQGRECSVVVEGLNNESTHPNTDVLVRSGGSEVVALDVERVPDVRTEADGTIVLGTEISAFLRLGADGVFSGGLVVTFECAKPQPTTTTTTEKPTTTTVSTTTTVPEQPTTSESPTTTSPPAAPTLPKTGGGSNGLLVAAGMSLLIGGAALVGAKLAKQRRGLAPD